MDPSVLLLSITSDNPAKNPKERSFERPLGLWKDLTFVRPIAQFSLSQREHYQHDCRHAQHKADHARQPRYTADAHRVKALKRGDRIRKRDKRQSRNKLTGIRTDHAQRTVTAEKCTDNKSDAAQKDQKIQCGLESLIQLDILFGLFRTIRTAHLKRACAHL